MVFRIGKKGGDCDIQLSGALVSPLHCTISNIDDVVTLEPFGDSTIFVNGDRILKREVVHHVRMFVSVWCVLGLVRKFAGCVLGQGT